ncbi:multiubiquitin domain-containing protein [Runella sp.]|uniref:multiubiquitin domain-containing protein n=1 Tax=Runella sp. TaxID=1960881 RepID=UPI0026296391|nr:multiubiquitin domain-containing protein [Runella sp.]
MDPIMENLLEFVNVHDYGRQGQKPPKAKKYHIQIDRTEYVVQKEHITGKELLVLAGKTPPERFQLNQRLHKGKVEKIDLDEVVCLTAPGIEKFMTVPLDQTEGELLRKQFALTEEDLEYLETLGLRWETINDSNGQWILIHDFPVIEGYNVPTTTVAVKLECGYPRTQLDMAYFFPALIRKDGQSIGAIENQVIDGKNFQRWSRHRTGENPWREGIDNLSTHLLLVSVWFSQEFQKHPKINEISA